MKRGNAPKKFSPQRKHEDPADHPMRADARIPYKLQLRVSGSHPSEN
jgi:hypothetical protein